MTQVSKTWAYAHRLFMALTLFFLALPMTIVGNENGIRWWLWRDAPELARMFWAVAMLMAYGWWDSSRQREFQKQQ